MEFDSTGIRSDIEIDVMSLDAGGLKKIGSFKPTREKYPYMPVEDQKEEVLDTSNLPIDQMTFTVITSLVRRQFFDNKFPSFSTASSFQIQNAPVYRSIHTRC